eukprot:scaffold59920_cov61-Attheya_sp.AAC.1
MECAISSYDRQCRQGSCHPPCPCAKGLSCHNNILSYAHSFVSGTRHYSTQYINRNIRPAVGRKYLTARLTDMKLSEAAADMNEAMDLVAASQDTMSKLSHLYLALCHCTILPRVTCNDDAQPKLDTL